ncbi:MAG: DUF1631 family protein [Pseudomonadota bacterium]
MDAVRSHCAVALPEGGAVVLDLEEMLAYLREATGKDGTARELILTQAEALGDPAIPGGDHAAVLAWLEQAQGRWQQQYPLEPELQMALKPLTPLLATQALTNPLFLKPGEHDLHRLLDAVQSAAIGWQVNLGRGAQPLLSQVERTVELLQSWWRDGRGSLSEICDQAIAQLQAERSRALRMARRNTELEIGRTRTRAARSAAARMINEGLDIYPLPRAVERFIKGHWYDSAQLVYLKYGEKSEQWRKVKEVTDTLLESMRGREDRGNARRQQIFELIARLPRDLRRWLLSLQHDAQALDQTIGRIESIHLQILKQKELEMDLLAFIPVDAEEAATPSPAVAAIGQGDWFALPGEGGTLRAQAAARIDDEQRVLFTNHMGLKAASLGYRELEALLASKRAIPLYQGASFSLSMAWAAGLETREQLQLLADTMPQPEAVKPQHIEDEAPTAREVEGVTEPLEEAAATDDFELELGSEPAAQTSPPAEATPTRNTEQDKSEWLQSEPIDTLNKVLPGDSMSVREIASEQEFELLFDDKKGPDDLSDSDRQQIKEYLDKRRGLHEQSGNSEPDSAFRLGITPDTWLGFHDGDQPTMAKMAIFDQERQLYIFVNREGAKLRELSHEALKDLMDRGLVDILQTRKG